MIRPFKKNHRYPWDVVLKAITFYYKEMLISYRDVSKMLEKEGVAVSHKTIMMWDKKYSEEIFGKIVYPKKNENARNNQF
jgi:transposase-like protein